MQTGGKFRHNRANSTSDSVPMTEQQPDVLSLTVPQLLRRRANESPSLLALSARSVHGWRDRLTYAQLVERMDAMAAGLAAAGMVPDDRIAIFLGNEAGRECILTSLGALRLGASVSPLNVRYADEELQHALDLVEPAAVVCTTADVTRIRRLFPPAMLLIVDGDGEGMEHVRRWPDPASNIALPAPSDPQDPMRLACLLFTSGTTARSKAVMHNHRTMIGAGLSCSTALGLQRGDLYQGGWPFFTSSGLNLGCMSSWVAGGGLVFEEPLSNAGRLELIGKEKSSFYHGVPSVIHFMIDEFSRGAYDVSSLRRIGYGGSAMPLEVVERIDRRWPHVEQVQIYGMTESGPSGTVLEPAMMREKAGSIGVAMPYCGLDILDEQGMSLPKGETGEIFLAGPGVATGYFRNPQATSDAFIHGGIRTGDIGHVDEDGYLFFTDRRKDVINRGGLKIASIAVEEVLYRHPSIREAAVFAIPHKDLGEDVAAAVAPVAGATLDFDEISAFCRDKLADYARPRRYIVLDELPKNPMGKILKAELRERFKRNESGV